MNFIDHKLQEFEARAPTYDSVERTRRLAVMRHFSAINRFEGLIPGIVDERMFELLAAGQISKQEYLQLCIADARGAS